ncbi:MAG: sigma-54 dependent transcriptional regulator [Candidatus Krumholzibacteriales bacterium]
MDLKKSQIWALSEGDDFREYLESIIRCPGSECRIYNNISGILAMDEPGEGIILAINSFGAFSNYLPVIKRFKKKFISYDIIVFGEEKSEEQLRSDYYQGVDLYISPDHDREETSATINWFIKLRTVKSHFNIIGRSDKLNVILDKTIQVAPTEVSVLLEGESGTGKEIIARTIHKLSGRMMKPFEEVNCGAFAEGVLESELFGHEKGSFTGAVGRRRGLFERADQGTIFLDEVGEMPLGMQVKLLRVLETGNFLRVGGIERIHSDVRIIAATNRNLNSEVEKGSFRRDLFYRLKVVQIAIPPLRERKEDIPLMVNVFVQKASEKHGKKIRGIEKEGLNRLTRYPWPGNVRELMNVIDNLVVMSSSSFISEEEIEGRIYEESRENLSPDLPVHVQKSREDMERELIMNSLLSLHNDVKEILHILRERRNGRNFNLNRYVEVREDPNEGVKDIDSIEKEAIIQALNMNRGNRRKAAEQLGISVRTLYRRLNKYNIS